MEGVLMQWRVVLILLLAVLARFSIAEEISVFDMRKTLAMADGDKVYRDFYLSKGFAAGLKPGMILTVKRRQPLYDTVHNRSAGDLNVAVGRIKVIHADKDIAVAREYQEFSRDDMPLLEDDFIMIGDEVDLSSATTESKVKGTKSAAVEVEVEKNSVDFASQAPDNTMGQSVDGPVVQ